MPLSASAVTASGQEEDAADTVYAGKKVAAAIAKVNEKLVADGINTAAGKTVRITTQKSLLSKRQLTALKFLTKSSANPTQSSSTAAR